MTARTEADVAAALRRLGVDDGDVLVVHASYRAVRPIEGGPLGLIRALETAVGAEGTLVMPAMTAGDAVFDPRATPTVDMGATAELFWRQDGVLRSAHPGASFAAAGPHAQDICRPHPLAPPHGPDSPVGRVHDLDGQVLLLGVNHSANTTVHLAETLAGVPYEVEHPCVVEVDRTPRTVMIPETDHCCAGFEQLDRWLRERRLQREGPVGNATARLARARDVVAVAVEHLLEDPLVFLCDPARGCAECDRARDSCARLSDGTWQRLRALFPPDMRIATARVLATQCGTNLPGLRELDAVGLERYRFAALKLSDGDLDRLREAVELANVDWRDLLVAAEFASDTEAHLAWHPAPR